MKEVVLGLILGLVIVSVIYLIFSPYYCLWKLKDIADEIEKIRKILEKDGSKR